MGRVGSWALCCKTFQQLSCLHGHVIHGKEWVTKSKLGCLCKRLLQEALEFLFIKNNYKDYITWNFVSKTTRIPQERKSTWHVWSALLYISLQNKNQKNSWDGYWDDVLVDVAILLPLTHCGGLLQLTRSTQRSSFLCGILSLRPQMLWSHLVQSTTLT